MKINITPLLIKILTVAEQTIILLEALKAKRKNDGREAN